MIFVSTCGAFVPLKSCNTSVNAIGTYVAICQYDSVMHMHEGGCQAKETAFYLLKRTDVSSKYPSLPFSSFPHPYT